MVLRSCVGLVREPGHSEHGSGSYKYENTQRGVCHMNIRLLLPIILAAMAMFVSFETHAQVGESTGNIVGLVENKGDGTYTVNATEPSTGRSRTATVSADGSFRFSQLPVGQYEVAVSKDGKVVARDTFFVSLNGNTPARFMLAGPGELEEVIVTATKVTGDVYSTDSGLVVNSAELKMIPVAANLTGVSLLAPGVVQGDEKFGISADPGLASFGGSSVAENSCYINGLEVTNTRQGLGCGSVPFEMYEQFQVKTGGYSAQYGRTTGGVMNAVTKSGSNDWEFGVGLAVEPGSLYESGKVSRGGGGLGGGRGGPGTGRVYRDTRDNENSLFEYWATVSGPIIRDHLFIYAIVNPRDEQQDFSWYTGSRVQYARDDEFRKIDKSGTDNLFWGAKVDWDITDYQRLSYFAYSNRNDGTDVHYPRNPITGEISDTSNQTIIRKRGGEAQSISYAGTFFENFTVSAMYGEIKTEYTSDPDDTESCPTVSDQRSPAPATPITGCGPGGSFGANFDENKQTRLDLEWAVGSHVVRAGLDKQERDSTRVIAPIGGHQWTYSTLLPNATIQGNSGPIYTNTTGANLDFVFDRIFSNAGSGGNFSSELTAYYLEDEWQLNENIVLYLGVRKDQLTNKGSTGIVFADFDQPWAPRVGFSWDPSGNGDNKIFSTWGRYYLPIPNNTNYRLGSGVSDTTTYYSYTGFDPATGSPTGIAPINGDFNGSTIVNSVATPPTEQQVRAKEANPFYKDEFIVGYERLLNDEYSAEVRLVYREVGSALDDYCGPYANQGYCTLLNPGKGGSWSEDPTGPLTYYTAEQIGLPKGKNEYTALQFQLNRTTDKLNYSFLYTLSESKGNFEGAVKSDIVQADAGITQDFDFPALMDGADGYLPNDRRHVFKFYGNYRFNDNWSAGW
ncbi:MAG: TonB-dependent receptor, partial [Gammaproteobacteria bacterium]|nr:TonB-dependent receptor [Gammaproteobacteria bacterium]